MSQDISDTDRSSRRILVTGGFGFLGSHLIEELLARGYEHIHVVDNLSSSELEIDRFLNSLEAPKLSYDIISVEHFCLDESHTTFDEIYHLASIVGPAGVLPHAGNIAFRIINDAKLLVDLCHESGAKLVDVSSSEVYGGGREGYCTERTPKIVPPVTSARLEYAIGKLGAEVMIQNSSRVRGLRASIVRPFNIAGPRQSASGGFVLPRFIAQAIAGEPLTVFGTGNQLRAFTHVKDVALGVIQTMECGRNGEAYNIGNPVNKVTILELAERVVTLTGSKSDVRLVDPKTIFGDHYAEAPDKYPDAHRAIAELAWFPTRSIDEIILESVDDWKSRHHFNH